MAHDRIDAPGSRGGRVHRTGGLRIIVPPAAVLLAAVVRSPRAGREPEAVTPGRIAVAIFLAAFFVIAFDKPDIKQPLWRYRVRAVAGWILALALIPLAIGETFSLW